MSRVYLGVGSPGAAGAQGPPGVGANWRGVWSSSTTYAPNDGVTGSNGHNYVSLAAGNLNHDPTTDGGVHWSDLIPSSVVAVGSTAPGSGATGDWYLVRSDGTIARFTPPTISVLAWRAVGNDDAMFAAWITGLNASAAAHGSIPAGHYTLTAAWPTITSPVTIDCSPRATLDWSGAASNMTFITAAGTEGTPVALTANALEGATSLSVAAGAEAGFPAGSYIRLGSSAIYDPGQSSTQKGEQLLVASTSSGTINLVWPVAGDAYNTTDTAQISLMSHVVGVTLNNPNILGGGTGKVHAAMKFDRCREVRVSNPRILGCEDQGLDVIDTIDARIDGGHIQDCNRSGTGYGVDVVSASQDVRVVGTYFQDCKHSVTTGSTGSRQGIVRRLTVGFCQTLANVLDTSLDCHGGTEDIKFIGNMSYGVAGQGIAVRCAKATIRDNTIMRAATNGIGAVNNTTQPTDFSITGNKVYNVGSGWSGISCTASTTTTCGLTQRAIHVAGNTVYGGAASNVVGILVQANVSGVYRNQNVNVSANTVDNCSNYGIYVAYADYANVTGNLVGDIPSAAYGIRLLSCTYCDVVGGNLRCSSSNGRGILIDTSSSHNTIDGVVGTGGVIGVNIDNTCTNNTVTASCDFSSNTTPYSLGTGAGNVTGVRRLQQAIVAFAQSGGGTWTPDSSQGVWHMATVSDTTAFTIGAPTNTPLSGHTAELTIEVLNSSGGTMGAITWNAAFVFPTGAWTNPASTKKRFARFEWNSAKWVCTSVASADY